MIDWTKGMRQRFRYYMVDRGTWRDLAEIPNVVSCEITRDLSTPTLESAKMELDGEAFGEKIVRVYAECSQEQDGRYGPWERFAMGTFICQTPRTTWSSGKPTVEVRAYSTLLALSDDKPSVFHTVRSNADCIETAISMLKEGIAPVIPCYETLAMGSDFALTADSSWLDGAKEVAAVAEMDVLVDPYGRPYLAPVKDPSGLSPSWTYEDGENSILMPGVDDELDWYGLPNAIEVVISGENRTVIGIAENTTGSAMSIDARGRRVFKRVTDADLPSSATQTAVTRYASRLLAEEGAAERKFTYEHGLCPVVLGDCVRVKSKRSGIDARARVVKQTIKLGTGCTVSEEATCKEAV